MPPRPALPPLLEHRATAECDPSDLDVPSLLSPTSCAPWILAFRSVSLRDVLDLVGGIAGIDVTYDDQFRDRQVSLSIDGMTLEDTLDHILTTNQLFYRVVDPTAIMVVPEPLPAQDPHDTLVTQRFDISHADVQELAQLLDQIVGVPKTALQPSIIPNILGNTITVHATAAVTSLVEQAIAANDRPRAEIVIDVEILEMHRDRTRRHGLTLIDYALDTASPLADRYLGVPAAVVRALQTDAATKLVAKPQLRGPLPAKIAETLTAPAMSVEGGEVSGH